MLVTSSICLLIMSYFYIFRGCYVRISSDVWQIRRQCKQWQAPGMSCMARRWEIPTKVPWSGKPLSSLNHVCSFASFNPFFFVFQQGDRPQLSEEMDKILWDFVQKKGMDQKMFRSLVSFEVQHLCKQYKKMISLGASSYNSIKLLTFNRCYWTPLRRSGTDPKPMSFWSSTAKDCLCGLAFWFMHSPLR